jgi:hypothetical protein
LILCGMRVMVIYRSFILFESAQNIVLFATASTYLFRDRQI